MMQKRSSWIGALLVTGLLLQETQAEDWPRWRGPDGAAVSETSDPPVQWDSGENVHWKVAIPGEGSSSPIVWDNRIFVTSALDDGTRRLVHCLDREQGQWVWRREIGDENPEITSSLTGHAASTPVTDGRHVVAFFGNAGVVCYDFQGNQLWRRRFGEFETELGLANSPILFRDKVLIVCDHDGDRLKTFDSFLIALDIRTGRTLWKTDRPGLYRSWSTPILVPAGDGKRELIVNAQDELRSYDPETGAFLWKVGGMTGWVTPSPVSGDGLIYATSGKNGPTLAARPGGRGDVTEQNLVWQHRRGAPYVCSPLWYAGHLYVHNEQGILTCYEAKTGELKYRERLPGKFLASAVAAAGRMYLANESGKVFVIRAGEDFRLLATNELGERCLASPAIVDHQLIFRTEQHVHCIVRNRRDD